MITARRTGRSASLKVGEAHGILWNPSSRWTERVSENVSGITPNGRGVLMVESQFGDLGYLRIVFEQFNVSCTGSCILGQYWVIAALRSIESLKSTVPSITSKTYACSRNLRLKITQTRSCQESTSACHQSHKGKHDAAPSN